jgi:hypothetical protein
VRPAPFSSLAGRPLSSFASRGSSWRAWGRQRTWPPRLVVGGLYWHVGYHAVAATIIGQALLLGQPVPVAYASAFAVAVAAFVPGQHRIAPWPSGSMP